MSVNVRAENGGMLPCKQTFLAGQQLGGKCLSGLIWQKQIVFMAAPRPSIRPATEDLDDSGRGHIVATETAFESSRINDIGCWHETKRRREMGGETVRPVLVVSSLDKTGLQLE